MAVINYDVEKLKSAISDFYNSTGVNINFLKKDFTSISDRTSWREGYCSMIQRIPEGRRRCMCSDKCILEKCSLSKKAEVHVCHAGLVDVAAPVVYNGEVIAYLILGQMKNEVDFSSVKKYISDLELDFDLLKNNYDKMTAYDEEKLKSIANLATMLTKYIMLESMLKPESDSAFESALAYIDANIDSRISLDEISHKSNISITSLYKYFHQYFNCTVSDYINKKRVEKSVNYLLATDMSIEIISQKVGFLSSSYYTRMFKKYMHDTPLAFRRKK